MNQQTEQALRMAIEALLYGTNHTKAVKACKAALQENALDRMAADNARELGLSDE